MGTLSISAVRGRQATPSLDDGFYLDKGVNGVVYELRGPEVIIYDKRGQTFAELKEVISTGVDLDNTPLPPGLSWQNRSAGNPEGQTDSLYPIARKIAIQAIQNATGRKASVKKDSLESGLLSA